MNIEVIALALLNAVRPTAFAAVYALLSSARPRRSLLAFTLSSFLFSATIGILVVTALHGVRVETGKSTVYALSRSPAASRRSASPPAWPRGGCRRREAGCDASGWRRRASAT